MQDAFERIKTRALQAWQERAPQARPRIDVALSGCSKAVGAAAVLRALEAERERRRGAFDLDVVGCNGADFADPQVDVLKRGRPRITYARVTPQMVPALVADVVLGAECWPQQALAADEALEGIPSYATLPFFKLQRRQVMRRWGLINPERIDDYLATGGYEGFVQSIFQRQPEEVIAEVAKSGLLGRGGAAFPTGRKWQTSFKARGNPKYIVCNGEEGEPAIYKDRRLLEADPHSVIEGMLIAGFAVGSDQGYLYIGGEHRMALHRAEIALRQARANGLLGKDILGSGFSFDIQLRAGGGTYAGGESSALMSSLEGRRGMPRSKLVRSAERGLWQLPTVMNNVETLANVPLIMANGADWYAALGSEKCKGTKILAPSGCIRHAGLVEVPFGITVRQLVFEVCGGIPGDRAFKAAQPGGVSGGCLPQDLLDTPIDVASFERVGAIVGSGGIVILDDGACMVDMVKYFVAFDMLESCDRCITCRVSTQRLRDIVERVSHGAGKLEDLDLLTYVDRIARETALCGLGQTAGAAAVSAAQRFREEWLAHIVEKRCPAGVCEAISEERLTVASCSVEDHASTDPYGLQYQQLLELKENM